MASWQVAPSCKLVLTEANRLYPDRSRASDGTVGDAAHSSKTSHHNPHPDGSWVDAVDLTHDPAHGCDAHAWARQVAARRDKRVEYLISNGRICRGYDKSGIPAWTWTRYTGTNPHTKHAHLSIWRNATARNDLRSWFTSEPAKQLPEEDDLTPEQDRMLRDVHAVLTNPEDPKAILPTVAAARDNTNRLRRMLRLVAAKVGADLGDAEK